MTSEVSVVIPVYNEADSIVKLLDEVTRVLKNMQLSNFEIIVVDDGSTDDSVNRINSNFGSETSIRVVQLTRNFGQSAAMACGFNESKFPVVIPLDGDGQNDPADIPLILRKFKEGYSCVSGWRRYRQDSTLSRKIPSRIANWFIGKITGVKLHDYGCTLKAYDRDMLLSFPIYGEMHRFLPIYMKLAGAKVAEIEVNHRPRSAGKSKYGIGRTYRVLLDILVAKAYGSFSNRPIHLFGGLGLIALFIASIIFIIALTLKFMSIRNLVETPLLIISIFFALSAINFILIGLVAELTLKNFKTDGSISTYRIKTKD